jgi:hypothetical protein
MIHVIDTPPEFQGEANNTKIGRANVRLRQQYVFVFPSIINLENQTLDIQITNQ